MARLLASFVALIRSWLTCDRIRASPSLQRLTSLQAGETVFVEGELAVVVRRDVEQDSGRSVLTLDCTTERGRASLQVCCALGQRVPQLTWGQEDRMSPIQIDDIVVPLRRT